MAVKTINVSELRCACLDEQWRRRWLAGEKPPTATFSPPGTPPVYGSEFHTLAERFVKWLTSPASRVESSRLKSPEEIFRALSTHFADKVLGGILARGEIDSAAALADALHNFSLRLSQLRERTPEFASWQNVYMAQEYKVKDVQFTLGQASLFVTGHIDCLRIYPQDSLEIVDYKLSHGQELAKDLIQITLYHQLLIKTRPDFEFVGTLEYFLPTLQVQQCSAQDLEGIFRDQVQPIFEELLQARPAVVKKQALVETKRPSSDLYVGQTRDLAKSPVTLGINELTRHAVFLGAGGSGKTTLALTLVEQLLALGIPAILVDRKGDLCRYADPHAWEEPLGDPLLEQRRATLRAKLDIALFTPGHAAGRPLAISVAPEGMAEILPTERDQVAKLSAVALASMMNYRSAATDQAKLAVLIQAIRIFSEVRPQTPVTLEALIEFINAEDPSLIRAVGVLDTRHFKRLVENLQTLQIMNGDLLAAYPDRLDARLLFGFPPFAIPSKTRLSIISTKFLGDKRAFLFWVAQLLSELGRFANKSPASSLQGIVLLDEADLYLPALSKPPTKEPMENLLKRARSAGLSLLLATQSPGDFDYKCKENLHAWFVGLVKEKTALEKMKPMLSESRMDVSAKLPGQEVGQFFLIKEGQAQAIHAERSLIKTLQLSEAEILSLAQVSLTNY